MRELALLIEEADALVQSLDRTLQEITSAMSKAQQPKQDLLSALFQSTRTEAVEPTIASVRASVQDWIAMMIGGGMLIVALIGLSFCSTA